MEVTLQIPDEIARHMTQAGTDLSRRALESFALERIALPAAVKAELMDVDPPPEVQRWIAHPPEWLEIHETTGLPQEAGLDEGETAAIALAESLHADMVLIREREGFRVARRKGLRVTGTLGVLDLAAERRLIDLAEAIRRLERTNFRRPQAVLEALLLKHKGTGGI
jgi:predicted nucleic acid-binding protein